MFSYLKILGVLVIAATVASADPCPLTVDGSVSDWGVTVADNNGSDMNSFTFAMGGGYGLLDFHAEDQDDLAGHGGYLGPNSGGQDYDGEMMMAAICDGRLYIAIVTGQRPDNGARYYSPGDIYLGTTDGMVIGIEVGGGEGGGAGTAITEGAQGTEYLLTSSGYTTSSSSYNSPSAGSIWLGTDANWILDPISPKGPVQLDASNAGAYLGLADYIYTRDSSTSQHAVIELSFDLSVLGGKSLSSAAWHPSCGNDELLLQVSLQPVPEPGTFVLLGSAVALLAIRRRRRA